MMKTLIFVSLFLVAGGALPKFAPLLGEIHKDTIEEQFIIVFKEETSNVGVESHVSYMKNLMLNSTNQDDKVLHEYSIGKTFRGYSAIMDEELLDQVRAMTEVKYVARNEIVRVQQSQCDQVQLDATWGLVRTTYHEWKSPYPDDYRHNKEDGEGVEIYILDSGIDEAHPLFGGRAFRGPDFIDNPPVDGDPNGHGTFVAGIMIADVYGLARSCTAISVRIVNSSGIGSVAALIAGIDYVAGQKNVGDSKKIVGNISLNSGLNQAINDAANACVDQGVHLVVAAGNGFSNACNYSPSSADNVFTVTASTISDSLHGNYGNCIDIMAPGANIVSILPNEGLASYTGTSMASAHVAGVIAKILATRDDYDDDPIGMKEFVKSIATKHQFYEYGILFFKSCE